VHLAGSAFRVLVVLVCLCRLRVWCSETAGEASAAGYTAVDSDEARDAISLVDADEGHCSWALMVDVARLFACRFVCVSWCATFV
jgi:hypothetical protein